MANDWMTDDDEDQGTQVAAMDDQPAPLPTSMPTIQPASMEQPDKASIIKAYLQANNDSGVRQAQDDASYNNNLANMGHALETIVRSNSMARGGAGVDNSFYQGIRNQGQQGIQQAQGARQVALNNFIQQHEITRQVAQDVMSKGTWEQQQKAAQFTNDLQDPNSRASKNSQLAFKNIFKDQPGVSDLNVDDFSAADLASASKNADVVAKLNEIKETKKMQVAYQQSALKDKKDTKQEQVYTDMNNKLTNPRGNTAVQQAAVGVASGKKAMDLINQYPDLNKMPSQQVALLAQEISKVASGGVGSEHGQRSLEANTVQSNWAKFTSEIDGEPTGAQLKGFIEQNKTYLGNMIKTNLDTIKDYQRQVYNGYKKRLSPDQDAQFRADNPDVFKEEELGANGTPPAGQGSPGKSNSGGIKPAWEHPKADTAKAWALANPNDPRSAEILKRLGNMNASNSK
jgi:hypothetical protein